MKTAALLLILSFAAAIAASDIPHTSPVWFALAWAVVVLFVATLLRVHAVVTAGADR